jgi:hypothetical protein
MTGSAPSSHPAWWFLGWSVRQAAWRLGVSVRTYREMEAGERATLIAKADTDEVVRLRLLRAIRDLGV